MGEINVTRSTLPDIEEYIEEIRSIWDSHWLTNMGDKHNLFQKKLCDYLNVDNLELLVNGHMAIELTIQAMGLKGEIITTPFTFASTTHAIVRNNITPVFCDIEDDYYTIDVSKIENLITDKTSAILPVHVYGNICNIEEIEKIARKHNLKVIYDAAHTFGETYKGNGIGGYGDASCFSFHATKVFNSIEGGAVSYNDKELGTKLYELKNFGIKGPEEVNGVGANAKMNEFCAAMGLCNLRHIDEEIEKRKTIFDRYINNLIDIDGLITKKDQIDVKSNYSYFPILINEDVFGCDRNHVAQELKSNGIYARKYFYPLTCDFKAYEGVFDNCDVPVARKVSERVLTLPIYSGLLLSDVDRICDIIRNCNK